MTTVRTVVPADAELISDQEIQDRELDAFEHGDFVDRLLAIVTETPTPARVALFAPWGSGKTSIGRLLAPRVGERGHEFAYFDAFKYAREPLLREFIIRVAAESRGSSEAEKWRARLYESQTGTRFRGDLEERLADLASGFRKLAERIGSRLVGVFVFAVLLIALLVDRGVFEIAALSAVGLAVAYALVAVAQATGMLGLIGDSLRITVAQERPGSPEQFEYLAQELIENTLQVTEEGKRLVVFVDELDRVDAGEVVETLETLKTFLDLRGCVFVVAADRRVMEKALALRARQETPVVQRNPYYSRASSYLDKIFQYQLDLPEVFPGRLSSFARDLANEHGGAWKELRDSDTAELDDVVSALVPIHVTSPRRVKVLMNAYVQAYRLAGARYASGLLGRPPAERSTEIAKLVVLRSEFPVFADELLRDPELVGTIPRWQRRQEQEADGVPEEELEPALSEDQIASIELALERPGSTAISYQQQEQPREKGQDPLAEPTKDQLVRYLEQTQIVDGPGEDLLRLESLGAPFGLPDRVAGPLRDAAYGNQPQEARALVEGLDQAEQLGAIRLLGNLLRHGVGLDADNSLEALLRVTESPRLSLERVATEIAPVIQGHLGARGIANPERLGGVLKVGVAAGSSSLINEALDFEGALTADSLRNVALQLAERLWPAHRGQLGRLLAVEVVADPEQAAAMAGELPQDIAPELVASGAALVAAVINDEAEAEIAAAVDGLEGIDPVESAVEFARRLEAVRPLRDASLRGLALARDEEAQSALSAALRVGAAISDADLAATVLRTGLERPYVELAQRLPAVIGGAIDPETTDALLTDLLAAHWRGLQSDQDEDATDTVHEALRALIGDRELEPSAELVAEIEGALNIAISDKPHVDTLRRTHANALKMADLGVVGPAQVNGAALMSISTGLGRSVPQSVVRNRLSPVLIDAALELLSAAPVETLRALIDQQKVLLQPAERLRVDLHTAAELQERGEGAEAPASRDELREATAPNELGAELRALWIRCFETEAGQVAALINDWRDSSVPPAFADAMSVFINRTGVDASEILRPIVEQVDPWPRVPFLGAAGARHLRGKALRRLVQAVSEDLGSARAGERALDLWEAADPSDATDRRSLILDFYLPLAEKNGACFDVAIERCEALCSNPPYGTKDALRDRLLAAAQTGSKDERRRRGKRAGQALVSVGLMEEPKRGLGKWARQLAKRLPGS